MDTQKLLDSYYNWLIKGYTVNKLDDNTSEIVTPFLDSINDNIYIYVTKLSNGKIQLTDDGYTLNNLELMGVELTSTRNKIIDSIRKLYNIDLIQDQLSIVGNEADFPIMKFNLISAINRIDSLSLTKRDNITSIFRDEVVSYFKEHDFGGVSDHPLHGASGLSYKIPYVIPNQNDRPYRIFETTSELSKNIMMQQAYEYTDIQKTGFTDSIEFFLIHKKSSSISSDVKNIAKDAEINILPWENKNELLNFRPV